jgi:hypothetical protein
MKNRGENFFQRLVPNQAKPPKQKLSLIIYSHLERLGDTTHDRSPSFKNPSDDLALAPEIAAELLKDRVSLQASGRIRKKPSQSPSMSNRYDTTGERVRN